jgi:hypothetical protein
MSEGNGNDNGRITLAVLQRTVELQGDETRRSLEALVQKLNDVCTSISKDHDTLVCLSGELKTEVQRAEGTHARLFTITDTLTDDVGKLDTKIDRVDSRDKWGSIGVAAIAVISGIIGWFKL